MKEGVRMNELKRIPDESKNISSKRIIELINEFCDGSQTDFCRKTGIKKSSLSKYVHGTAIPTNIKAGMIAEAFHVSPAWVMGFDVPKNESNTNSLNTLINLAKQLSDKKLESLVNFASYMVESEKT